MMVMRMLEKMVLMLVVTVVNRDDGRMVLMCDDAGDADGNDG